MAYPIDYTKRIYCLITGASQGIGRTIAIELARRSTNKLTLVLIARSEKGLSETKDLVGKVKNDAKVVIIPLDLYEATVDQYNKAIDQSLVSEYDQALIFHNAGHLGETKKCVELSDIDLWKKYYNLNVVSVTVLNAVFLKKVKAVTDKMAVVNITSLVGRKAFKYLSMYGSGKAARDIYFKVLAEEEPGIIVLNYSPGMVETSMSKELLVNMKNYADSEISAPSGERSLLTSEDTVNKMLTVLEKAAFKSGDIVDYFDIN